MLKAGSRQRDIHGCTPRVLPACHEDRGAEKYNKPKGHINGAIDAGCDRNVPGKGSESLQLSHPRA